MREPVNKDNLDKRECETGEPELLVSFRLRIPNSQPSAELLPARYDGVALRPSFVVIT